MPLLFAACMKSDPLCHSRFVRNAHLSIHFTKITITFSVKFTILDDPADRKRLGRVALHCITAEDYWT